MQLAINTEKGRGGGGVRVGVAYFNLRLRWQVIDVNCYVAHLINIDSRELDHTYC